MSIKQKGLKEVIASLSRLPEQAARQAEKTLHERLPKLLDEVNENTPVKTGFLKSRNKIEITRKEMVVKGEIINDAPYALSVHERPAEESAGSKFIEKVAYGHAQEVGETLGKDQVKMLEKMSKERGH